MSNCNFDIMLAASGAFAPDGQPLSAYIEEIEYDGYGDWSFIKLGLYFVRGFHSELDFPQVNVLSDTRVRVDMRLQNTKYRRVFIDLPIRCVSAACLNIPSTFMPYVFKQIEQLERRLHNERLLGETKCRPIEGSTKES